MTLTNADKKWMLENFVTKSDQQQSEKNIKGYIHEGMNAVVHGIDNLLDEK